MTIVQPTVPRIHDFAEQLRWSEAASCEPFWEAVYRRAFPSLVNFMPCPGDTESQRLGIDRVLLLANGQILKIDEKKRRRDYGDMLLEYVSNDRTGAPGWIEKDLAIDYLAYGILPTRRCYLFPFATLRRAWLANCVRWKSQFDTKAALNASYRTLCLAVPMATVQAACIAALCIDVSADVPEIFDPQWADETIPF